MERTHDSLGRRLRQKRKPNGDAVALSPRDIEWLLALHHHGPLPTSYLHKFTKATHKNYQSTCYRLRQLFHEGAYVTRPRQQFNTKDAHWNELVHQIAPTGEDVLKERGLWQKRAPRTTGPFKHQLMVSCITASFELNAKAAGIRYIHQHEILERSNNDLLVEIDGGILRPDGLFALEIDGKYVVYFLEADRGTEPLSTDASRKSWNRNIAQYRKLIGHKVYRNYFNLEAPAVLLNVTISNSRRDAMVRVIGHEYPRGCSYIFNYALPEFNEVFRPPREMEMLSVSWERAEYPNRTIHQKNEGFS